MAVVKKGDNYITLAKRLGVPPEVLQRVNNYAELNTGQTITVPRMTEVGERGPEFVYDTPGPGMQVIPADQTAAMKQQGLRAGRGMAMGGYLNDDPYGGIDPYNPPQISYINPTPAPLQTYTDTIRIPGQAPVTVTSAAPKPVTNTFQDDPYGGIDPYNPPQTSYETEQTYADTIRVPGQAPTTVTSQGPTQEDLITRQEQLAAYPNQVLLNQTYAPPTSQQNYAAAPQIQHQTYTDTIRVPGQAPVTVSSQGPETFETQTTPINPYVPPEPGIYTDTIRFPGQAPWTVLSAAPETELIKDTYHTAIINYLNGGTHPFIPDAVLGQLDISFLDPEWYGQYHDQLAELGYSEDEIAAWWLNAIGYEVDESGHYMKFTGGGGGIDAGGDGGGPSAGSAGGGYRVPSGGGYGYPYNPSNYRSAVMGLVNWRGVGFA